MKTVLIIEDNNDILEDTATLLQLEGYRTLRAQNGQMGLEKISEHLPDIILCDWLMPKMDGFTLLKYLRGEQHLKHIPFIFFSAKSEKVDINKGIQAGASAYVVKPFELEELLGAIDQCLA